MSRARAYLQLVRLPNLFTAAADVLAGYLFVGGGMGNIGVLSALVAASACLYAGGVALNDVLDASRDAASRPSRPIPSGAVSRTSAAVLAVALLATGCGFGFGAGNTSGRIALLLALCVVLYDGVLKTTPLAPPVMGTCRALNLLLGMSAFGPYAAPDNVFCALLMGLYVASVTFFAGSEARESAPWRLRLGFGGALAAVLGLCWIPLLVRDPSPWWPAMVGVLLIRIVPPAWRALATRAPADVQGAVKSFVVSIILFDACLAMVSRGPAAALAVLSLLIPTVLLGRRFPVT